MRGSKSAHERFNVGLQEVQHQPARGSTLACEEIQCQPTRGSLPAVKLEGFVSKGSEEGGVVVREGGKVHGHGLTREALHQLTRARLPQVGLRAKSGGMKLGTNKRQ